MPTPTQDARAAAERLAARLYLCLDAQGYGRAHHDLRPLRDLVAAALDGGVDVVRLRDKHFEAAFELRALEVLAREAERAGALVAVNDRADVAALAGAPVLHVGQDDLTPAQARRVAPGALVGLSTHDDTQLCAALDEAAAGRLDHFCCGPVWATPTEPGRPASGLDLVRTAARSGTEAPWFAIGGIDETTLDQVVDAGATRVVVVRAITGADYPRVAAQRLRRRLPDTPARPTP